VLTLGGRLERDAFLELLEARLLAHRRFRQRVVVPRWGLGAPCWQDDPTFDLRSHLHHLALPEPRDARALEQLVGDLVSTPLPRSRPLWQMHLVDGAEGTLVVVRVHHCLADGLGLIALLGELADGGAVPRSGIPVASSPERFSRGSRLLGGLIAAGQLLARRPEARNSLHGQLGVRKLVAASSALRLEDLLAKAHANDATLTELLLAALARALGTWPLASRRALHALVPVSLRSGPSLEDGTRFASVFVPLPVGIAELRGRVRSVQASFRPGRTREARVTARAVGAAGAVTAALVRFGVSALLRRASVTVSSIRGPAQRLQLAGVPLHDVMAWAPTAGGMALGVTLVSYAGRARLCVEADARVIGDPSEMIDMLVQELSDGRAPSPG
jgi:hypothetical protein